MQANTPSAPSTVTREGPAQTAAPPPNRLLRPTWRERLKAVVGLPTQRRLAQAVMPIAAIRDWEAQYTRMTDPELKQVSARLRGRSRGGETLDRLLPEAFGLVCVAAQRTLKMRPFDVQLAAGSILHQGAVAELATGEGKTLTASLPVFLNALPCKGVHVATVNDYLAKRDAEWMGPIYQFLGLTLGVLQQKMEDSDRTAAYRCDITYGTASEFGFDFLRDRLKLYNAGDQAMPFWSAWQSDGRARPQDPRVQREHNFALVDEADSIFIDEARTPLIIGGPTRPASDDEKAVYLWSDKLAKSMVRDKHFTLDDKHLKVEMTEDGKRLVRYSNPPTGPHSHAMDKLHEHVERAIHANHRYRLDQHYMIHKNKVIIIDEYTGRPQPDRHWRDGLHQAVEAKEGVTVTKASDHAAKVTFQSYFKLYKKLSGMTGTAAENWMEIRRVYKIWVVQVPTNRRVVREVWPDRVFPNEEAKFNAIVTEIQRLHRAGRPVLIGTRSVAKSEILSDKLRQAGIEHQVLNARQHEQEAHIVARAGEEGRVTIATNMAGRGTDIKLAASVAAKGGLHVLGTERHDARRVDRQLLGRAGRQGDPGSGQFFLSLEDELLEGLGPERQLEMAERGRKAGSGDWQSYGPHFHKAQRRMERRHRVQRVDLMHYEKQRQETLKELSADPYVD
ncbi:preprotein translocase subunit SecA [Planctomycetaceae bacterium SCGC AG-212-F19]|nr:preprotein translocase subunit SecA [Planctomycetaceae bacterium SCGC AG-212-F19]